MWEGDGSAGDGDGRCPEPLGRWSEPIGIVLKTMAFCICRNVAGLLGILDSTGTYFYSSVYQGA